MKVLFKTSLLSLSACHVLRSTAWIIDQSCNSNTAPASVIQDALQSAFAQANAGLTAITQNPQDPNYASLQKLLFPDEAGWPRVQQVLQNVVGLNTQGTDRTSPNEIIIYCDLSRITTNDDGILWDPDVQGPFDNLDNEFKTCRSTDISPFNLFTSTALSYATGLSGTAHDDHVMQIQLCAWYAKFMAKSQYKTGGRFTLFRLAAKLAIWFAKSLPKIGITVMDTLSLLDNVLLHELTHTRAAGHARDIAYTWKKISANMIGGSNNADSIAYFCLGCTLINNGSMPQQDGTLKDCPIPAGITQPNSKRQLHDPVNVIKWEA